VQITSCRATVSNTPKVSVLVIHCLKAGRTTETVTSQETCLYSIDNAFVV